MDNNITLVQERHENLNSLYFQTFNKVSNCRSIIVKRYLPGDIQLLKRNGKKKH